MRWNSGEENEEIFIEISSIKLQDIGVGVGNDWNLSTYKLLALDAFSEWNFTTSTFIHWFWSLRKLFQFAMILHAGSFLGFLHVFPMWSPMHFTLLVAKITFDITSKPTAFTFLFISSRDHSKNSTLKFRFCVSAEHFLPHFAPAPKHTQKSNKLKPRREETKKRGWIACVSLCRNFRLWILCANMIFSSSSSLFGLVCSQRKNGSKSFTGSLASEIQRKQMRCVRSAYTNTYRNCCKTQKQQQTRENQ